MSFKKVFIFLIFTLIFYSSHTPIIKAAPKVQFSIAYTNDVMGEVEPCG